MFPSRATRFEREDILLLAKRYHPWHHAGTAVLSVKQGWGVGSAEANEYHGLNRTLNGPGANVTHLVSNTSTTPPASLGSDKHFFECFSPTACTSDIPGQWMVASANCPVGYQQPLCSVCEPGFSGGNTAPCIRCENGSTVKIILAMVVLAAPVWYCMSRLGSRAVAVLGFILGMLRAVITNIQIVAQLPSIFRDLPQTITVMLGFLSIFTVNIFSSLDVRCLFEWNYSFYTEYAVAMCLPVLGTLVCLVLYVAKSSSLMSLDRELLAEVRLTHACMMSDSYRHNRTRSS